MYIYFTRSNDGFTDWLVWRCINYIVLCAVYDGSGWRVLKDYTELDRDVYNLLKPAVSLFGTRFYVKKNYVLLT